MKKQISFNGLMILIIIIANNLAIAQTKIWKTESIDEGKIVIKSCVSERKDGTTTLPLIEYVATTSANVNYQKCLAILKDINKHKSFLDLKSAFQVKEINETESIIYYCFNTPWPFTPTDCVNKMTFNEDKIKKTANFNLQCSPNSYKQTDYKRFSIYSVIYTFKDLGNGKVEITINACMSPPVSVPLMMIRVGFPGIASDIVKKIIKAAQ